MKRLGLALGLGAFFFLVYNVTNYLASQAPQQVAWHFSWELEIPVIAWLILPYWSIDLLFVIAFLVCTTRNELRILSMRIAASIIIAGIIFWLCPLTLAFERTEDHGIWSPLFAALYSFDAPHNLFPSLHVTFAVILRWTFARHVRSWALYAFHLWFALITLSTIFVHQHHLIDIAGGALLGCLVMYCFDEEQVPAGRIVRNKRSRKLTLAYSVMGLMLCALAIWLQGWYLLFLWPAFSVFAVALGYAGLGARICQSRQAGPSIAARILLFPWLEVLGWSRRYWWHKPLPPSPITDNVSVGRIPDIKSWQGHVIDCTCEHRRRHPQNGNYERMPMLDLAVPNAQTLRQAAETVEAHVNQGQKVLIVCGLGLGRSALTACAYLLISKQAQTVAEAIDKVRHARPQVTWSADAEIELAKLVV